MVPQTRGFHEGAEVIDRSRRECRTETAGDRVASHYELLEFLGAGGFGQVWRARDTRDGSLVALKLIERDDARTAAWREAYILRRLHIPSVAKLYEEGPIEERHYLAMEFVDGAPFPGATGPRRWESIALLATHLLRAMQQVHAAGVLHRDLKPANVLVTPKGEIKLLDFGLSFDMRMLKDSSQAVTGSVYYLAPEQLRGEHATVRSDIYALGVMLYEALTGRLPREGDTMRKILRALFTHPTTPTRELAPRTPPEIAALVDRMIAIEPDERPASLGEALAVMEGNETVSAVLNAGPRLPPWLWRGALAPTIEAISQRTPHELALTAAQDPRDVELLSTILIEEGFFPLLLGPGEAPLESLLGMVDDLHEASTMEDVRASTSAYFDALFPTQVILAQERTVDRHTWELLTDGSWSAPLLLLPKIATPGAGMIPCAPDMLEALFGGARFALDLPARSARALHARTGGDLFAIQRELDAWIASGLARRAGRPSKIYITHEALCALERGARPVMGSAAALDGVDEATRDLFVWMASSWPHASVDLCASLQHTTRWEVELRVRDLIARGLVRELDDGRLFALPILSPIEVWDEARIARAHARIAKHLDVASLHRARHSLEADALDDVLEVLANASARDLLVEETSFAEEIILGALALAHQQDAPHVEEVLLGYLLELVLSVHAPLTLERLIATLRQKARDEHAPKHAHFGAMLAMALLRREHLSQKDLRETLASVTFEHPGLERHRRALMGEAPARDDADTSPEVFNHARLKSLEARARSARAAQEHRAILKACEAWEAHALTPSSQFLLEGVRQRASHGARIDPGPLHEDFEEVASLLQDPERELYYWLAQTGRALRSQNDRAMQRVARGVERLAPYHVRARPQLNALAQTLAGQETRAFEDLAGLPRAWRVQLVAIRVALGRDIAPAHLEDARATIAAARDQSRYNPDIITLSEAKALLDGAPLSRALSPLASE